MSYQIISNEIGDDGEEAGVEEIFPPNKIKTVDDTEFFNKYIQWFIWNNTSIENIFVLKKFNIHIYKI